MQENEMKGEEETPNKPILIPIFIYHMYNVSHTGDQNTKV